MKDPHENPENPTWAQSIFRMILRLGIVFGLIYLGHQLVSWLMMNEDANLWWALLALTLGYAVLISIPFVPGVEVGLGMLFMQGASIAPLVWIGSAAGLCLAFFVGHFTPDMALHRFFADLRMERVCRFILRMQGVSQQQRLEKLTEKLPKLMSKFLVDNRYLTLAVLVNVPGSTLIGGGGGIALTAGLSRLFTPWIVVLVFCLATAPVPLAVIVFGPEVAEWLSGKN